MASEPIHIHDDIELSRVFDEADDQPVMLEHNGRLYRLSFVTSSVPAWSDERRIAVLRALDEFAGSWSDIDAEQVIDDLYKARLAGSRHVERD